MNQLIEQTPLWLVSLIAVALVIASIQGGLVIARIRRTSPGGNQEGPIGSAVGATLGLLAFMLAFTFGLAASQRGERRNLLLDEVNAIGTTFLRADLIPEPHRSDVRRLLRRYVDIRLEVSGQNEKLPEAIRESKLVQEQIWKHAAALPDAELKQPDLTALFIESLNEMIDMQTSRVTVGVYRVPDVIWLVLAALTVVSMAVVGYQFGVSGRGNWLVTVGLGLSFSLVILLIVDLDRTSSGFLKISNQPMVELRADLGTD